MPRKPPRSPLAKATARLTPAAARSAAMKDVKDAVVTIRCTEADKVDMQAIATRYRMTLTDYLLTLHRLVSAKLRKG